MPGNSIGQAFVVTTFGESHGGGIGGDCGWVPGGDSAV